MPELPEVETTRLGIIEYVKGFKLLEIQSSKKKLRYPCDFHPNELKESSCLDVKRRAKYLIIEFDQITLLIHLGMSGSLRVEESKKLKMKKHDHYVFGFDNGISLVYHDPRRFGFIVKHSDHWVSKMSSWGPEPLSKSFCALDLYKKLKLSNRNIKQVIMDQKVVVGVGNIYANEVLFKIGIHPMQKSSAISKTKTMHLVKEIKNILNKSIEQGGTTLRDFVSGKEQPGYFKQSLMVYGRTGEPCTSCNSTIERLMIAQRSSFYCPKCQTFSDKER